jgi:hypothetical protein
MIYEKRRATLAASESRHLMMFFGIPGEPGEPQSIPGIRVTFVFLPGQNLHFANAVQVSANGIQPVT